jgi:MFS superfamily sulfate permease-like transporter
MRLPLQLAALPPAALLYAFPSAPYPPCPIHAFTGLLCPGCGATHALAALVHGHLQQAFHANPLFVLLLPLFFFLPRRLPAPALYLLLAATLAFTIGRNIPTA